MNRVAVFGLDGATFALIKAAVQQGELPQMSKLLEQGAHGELESTIPPITGAAWSSFQTGVNPGRHGVFDWLTRQGEGYRLRPIDSRMIKQPRLWDYVGERGGRVAIVGVPVTYPPRPVNGCLITGILTPREASYTYPPELARELEVQVGRFPFIPEHWPGRYRARQWVANLKRSVELRKRIAKHLIKKHQWELFMLHFMETDSIQHQMWHVKDGVERPRYRAPVEGDPVLEVYQAVDEALSELLEDLPSGTAVFLLSDHGFGPLYWNAYLNVWLLQKGFLALKRSRKTALKRAAFKFGLTQEGLFPWAERLRLLGSGSRLGHAQIHDLLGRFFLSFDDVDWWNTRAYSYGNIGQIYLNRKGREPRGIVEEAEAEDLIEKLITGLSQFVNPHNGEPVIERIYRREEIYHGELLGDAPEILFLPRPGYMALGATDFPACRAITPTFAGSGWHTLFGILIGKGADLTRGQIRGARLIDMLPTILYAMGLPIPRRLDGHVVEELFTAEYRAAHPVEYYDQPEGHTAEREEHKEWEAEIRRRLQDLGYI